MNQALTSRITQTAQRISHGDIISLERNTIKQNKILTLTADILSLDSMDLRHGKDIYGASGIVIDSEAIHCYNYTTERTPTGSFPHGLAISGKTQIAISVGVDSTASICITANQKTFRQDGISWIGTNGSIEVESLHSTMENVAVSWDCSNYSDSVWLFGDSYFTYYEERWPYYLVGKYSNFLLSGFPGASSAEMYPDFQQALTHATPVMAVWCLGMNDPDADDCINPAWKTYAQRFIADCEDRQIIPVLATIPNVPDRLHCHKNEYIRASSYRYIDFASAVGANEAGSGWKNGMLSADRVHPAAAGAKALAAQVLLDLPEIKP